MNLLAFSNSSYFSDIDCISNLTISAIPSNKALTDFLVSDKAIVGAATCRFVKILPSLETKKPVPVSIFLFFWISSKSIVQFSKSPSLSKPVKYQTFPVGKVTL